jgi:hypothetical protein
MPTTEQTTVVAVFEDRGHAEAAIDELWHAGFRHDQIGIATPGGHMSEATTANDTEEENAGTGAVAGAVGGGVVGALAGALVMGLVPGIGPVLAGGILTGIVLGGAAGAAAGSYLGPFIALGLSEDEARIFERELKAGRTIVTVKADDRAAEVQTILHSHGGHKGDLPNYAAAGRAP